MRKGVLYIFIISFMMLAACDGENTDTDESSDGKVENTDAGNNTSDVEEKNTENEGENNEAKQKESEETNEVASTDVTLSDAEAIFEKTAQAMQQVEGMAITGEMTSTSDTMGTEENEDGRLTGEISMNPFAQHYKINSVSNLDGEMEMEMYMTEDALYTFDSNSSGWHSFPLEQVGVMGNLAAVMTVSQIHYFASIHELFELSEEDRSYKLTFTGSGDEFKNVSYGVMKEIAGKMHMKHLRA